MSRSKPKPYTPTFSDEYKAIAVQMYQDRGAVATAAMLGLARSTLTKWAKEAGLDRPPSYTYREQNAALAARGWVEVARAARLELIGLMAETAVDLVKRIHQPHVELKVLSVGDGVQQVERVMLPRPPASAVKDYAIAAAILVDKMRLELGEVNARVEVRSGEFDKVAANPEAAKALEALWRQIGSEFGGNEGEDGDGGGADGQPALPMGGES